MSGKGREKQSQADEAIASYLDDLLSVPADEPVYLDDDPTAHDAEPEPPRSGQDREAPRARTDIDPPVVSDRRPKARRPQEAPVATKVREAPNLQSSLVSQAIREIPEPAPLTETPEQPREAIRVKVEPSAPAPEAKQAPVSPAQEPQPKVNQADHSETQARAPEPDPWVEGRPAWAGEGFECLIFRVAGLQLAVPLILLGQVHRLDRELTPLVGRPDWFLGLLTVGQKNIRVVDTARWVMPERYREDVRDNYQFVIQLGDSSWGLACDEVAQSFRVTPDEVKWRSEHSRRQWLAGTIKKQMCALLDVSRLAGMLAEAEKGRTPDLSG